MGSATAGGLTTTCKRTDRGWVLNGQKKWIGNSTFSDITIIWARDVDDNQVKGFIVRKENPGFSVEKIKGKMALRIVQNGLITMTDCVVPESDRLPNAQSFKDTAKVLQMTRAGVAWMAVGCARGAYENALAYTLEREQFGKPIASFQLIQNHLVEMLSNLTAMQTLVFRLSELQDDGKLKDEHASLAKVFCTLRTRDIVSRAREVMGGNGILLEYNVARFLADAEAIYSYEGTKEIRSCRLHPCHVRFIGSYRNLKLIPLPIYVFMSQYIINTNQCRFQILFCIVVTFGAGKVCGNFFQEILTA